MYVTKVYIYFYIKKCKILDHKKKKQGFKTARLNIFIQYILFIKYEQHYQRNISNTQTRRLLFQHYNLQQLLAISTQLNHRKNITSINQKTCKQQYLLCQIYIYFEVLLFSKEKKASVFCEKSLSNPLQTTLCNLQHKYKNYVTNRFMYCIKKAYILQIEALVFLQIEGQKNLTLGECYVHFVFYIIIVNVHRIFGVHFSDGFQNYIQLQTHPKKCTPKILCTFTIIIQNTKCTQHSPRVKFFCPSIYRKTSASIYNIQAFLIQYMNLFVTQFLYLCYKLHNVVYKGFDRDFSQKTDAFFSLENKSTSKYMQIQHNKYYCLHVFQFMDVIFFL
eukprot:TRINITY_DN6175_c1_g1_i9.p4 TRINITY_DN6175_c1_g1~~TRINITY_DN6175_c1_g1_i9.p4  ORF type:complete len:333 (-),score=-34.36 TRINITY_DN6175_c1_g1_i9:524-1522(-)